MPTNLETVATNKEIARLAQAIYKKVDVIESIVDPSTPEEAKQFASFTHLAYNAISQIQDMLNEIETLNPELTPLTCDIIENFLKIVHFLDTLSEGEGKITSRGVNHHRILIKVFIPNRIVQNPLPNLSHFQFN